MQQEGLNPTVADKLTIARQLDGLGVGYIEGGWPGANPKDTEFFRGRRSSSTSSTRSSPRSARPRGPASRAAGRPADRRAARQRRRRRHPGRASRTTGHVEKALRTTLEENLAMVRDTVGHLRAEGQQVFLDAEHFFDGYRVDRAYALEVLRTAYDAGADVVALCDTNGGMLPGWVADVVATWCGRPASEVGIHCHNDTGCAVANTLAAVDAGATHVQGCINGYGERTGNADLVNVVANLELKLDRRVLPPGLLRELDPDRARGRRGDQRAARDPGSRTSASRRSRTRQDCTRRAIKIDPDLYQHMDPARGRQRHAAAGLRDGRSGVDRAQGPRSSASTSPSDPDGGHPGDRPGQGAGGAGLHVRGCRRLVRDAAHGGGRGPASVVLRRRVVAGRSPRPSPSRPARRRSPRRPSSCGPRACATS